MTEYANGSTVFFYSDIVDGGDGNANVDDGIINSNDAEIDDADVYAGYSNAPTLQSSSAIRAEIYKSGTRVVAVVFTGTNLTTANVDDVLYIADRGTSTSEYQNATAIIDGETVDIQVELGDIDSNVDVYTYTINDGIYALTPIISTPLYDDNRVSSDSDGDGNVNTQYGVYSANSNTVIIGSGAPAFSTGRFEVDITADTVVIDNSAYQDEPVVVDSVHDGDYIAYAVYSDSNGPDELKMIVIENPETNQSGGTTTNDEVVNGKATLSKDASLTDVTPKTIQVASTTGNLKFSFELAGSAGKTVNYSYTVYLNDEWQADVDGSATADGSDVVTVSDNTTLNSYYTSGDEVEIVLTNVVVPDNTAPTLVSAEINGTTLTLTYSETLDDASTPDASDFTVAGITAGNTVSSVAVSGTTVTLTMANAAVDTDTVTVSYTVGTNPIQDVAGNDAAALTTKSVTNNTP